MTDVRKALKEHTCKGLIFRANVSCCRTQLGIGFFVRLNLLKRKSCPGCDSCSALFEQIGEFDTTYRPIGIESVKDGKLYQLQYCNVCRDPETGIVDDYDICLQEYQEEKD